MKTYWIFIVAALWLNRADATHQLFPQERSTYVLELSSKVSAGTVLPAAVSSAWQLSAELRISIIDDSRWRLTFAGLKTSLENGYANSDETRSVFSNIPVAALVLARPWEVHVSPTGSLAELKLAKDEPVWSANLKRAISVSLQLQVVDSNMPGSYTVLEPCLYGTCFAEYSSADGVLFRKSHAVPTDEAGLGRTYWASVAPDFCSKDAKKPFIGNVERWYRLDSKGLQRLDVIGDLQLHSHNHLLSVLTNMTITRASILPLEPLDAIELSKATSPTYQVHSFKDPTNERHLINQDDLITDTINLLIKLADGIDDQRVGKDPHKVHDPALLLVRRYMSQLTLESFQKLFNDIDLGTSYRQETMRNIFFEILPQVKSRDSAVFVKNLIFQQKITDEPAVLQMIRKLPFNIADYSSGLLVELEGFLKFGPDFSKDVRYSAVLSFATIVYNSYVNGGCSTDEFEEYIANYFSRYTDSATYSDRLIWLQGLHNLQLGSVSRYLAPILTDHTYSRHDRFLTAWAMWPGLLGNGAEINHLYWPILTNNAEHLEMKIMAIAMLLHGSPTPERLLSLHWHVMASSDQQLRRFWYTTLQSLEKTTYNCYQQLSKMVSYIAKLVPPPSLRHWATGYYLVDVADVGRDAGAVLQVLSIGNTATGLPAVINFSLLTQHQGRVTQRYEVYLKAQGVASNFINKLGRINAQSMKMEDLAALLKEIKVQPRIPEEVHIELVIKVQGKAVYATHINGTTFDQWTNGDIMETMNSILQSESHVNQQMVQYHMQLTKHLPTEIGTPVILETVVGSLSSLRGNLTHSIAEDELARHNDVHVRLTTVASTSLSTYGPILDSMHTVDVQQAAVIHLPLKFHFAVVPARKILKLAWLNEDNTGGLAWHSQAVVTLTKGEELPCSSCAATYIVHAGRRRVEHEDSEHFFDCESPISGTELLGQLVDSHKSNYGSFPSLRTVLATLHTAFLSGLPPAGPCGVLLSANSQLGFKAGTRLRMELELDELEMVGLLSWKIRHLIVLEENKENGTVLTTQNGTTSGESTDYGLRLALKSQFHNRNNPEDIKLCIKLETTHPDGPTQDLSSYPGPFQGEFAIAVGTGPSVCPGGATVTRLKMRYKGAVLVDKGTAKRLYDVHFYGVNLPEVIPKLAQSVTPILHYLPQTRNLVALQHLAGKLAETPQNISASIQIENGQTKIELTGPGNNSTLRLDGEQLALVFDYWNRQQLMRELGLLRECRLQPSSIKNVYGQDQSFVRGKCGETLAAADCSDSPRFALFHEELDSSHGVTLYTGGHYARVSPGTGGQAEVTVNGRRVEYYPQPYQFPEFENFYDFKISGDATSVRLYARISGITLAWTAKEAVLLLPTTYMQTACGACIRQDRLIERCPGHR